VISRVTYLKDDWLFQRISDGKGFKDTTDNWETVRVPHDWAIYGPFNKDEDIQFTKVLEDGQNHDLALTGRTGGLPVTGKAWYKKIIFIASDSQHSRLFLEFDGVMSNSTVYVNNEKVGSRPYGYISFSFEITDYVKFGEENIISLSLENKKWSSRWYSGAGIYRNVRLVETNSVHVKYHGTYITTSVVESEKAIVDIETKIINHLKTRLVSVVTIITDSSKNCVAEDGIEVELTVGENCFLQHLTLISPELWSVKSPNIYFAETLVIENGNILDRYMTSFGIRTIEFDCNKGFFLNGEYLKLKGVCMHHDMGAIGAAVNTRAIERQLEILQDMGCNAIRTSHNPPASELLDLCDQMGFLVIDEAFDEWRSPKVKNGYSNLFDEWAERDLMEMIERDRNHPSVIMWSIGNEICEIHDAVEGPRLTKYLQDICHNIDCTRPVTAGFNICDNAIKNGLAEIIDIPGWNYAISNGSNLSKYEDYHKVHPEWIMYGSETVSCVSSRGEYYLPLVKSGVFADVKNLIPKETLHVGSYDMDSPPWGYHPDYEFFAQKKAHYILGEFVWAGFDYLGEPTPYKTEWPSRSSYFGIVDLCGIPKDRFYSYQAEWTDKEVLHIFPHWNWEGCGHEYIPVHCYTNFNSVELFVNGKSYGIKSKKSDTPYTSNRIMWDKVKYEPGELKAVAYDENGNVVKTQITDTADTPSKILLYPDRTELKADGDDLSYIKVSVCDKDGNICPKADNMVSFSVEGSGELLAVDNGDQTSLESFQADSRKVFNGLCMLTVRSCKSDGEIRIDATSKGLEGASLILEVK
jgi:beta-galactosidase